MYPEFQLREEHFIVLENNSDIIKAGSADPFKAPAVIVKTSEPNFPFKDGFVEDWDSLEAIWSQALKQMHVKKSRNHSPVLVTVPSKWTRQDKERIVQMFFEKFNVPGLYIAEKPLATLYGYGQQLNGIVVDFQLEEITVTPIVETQIMYNAMYSFSVGFLELKKYLKNMLVADAQFMQEIAGVGLTLTEELLEFILYNASEASSSAIAFVAPTEAQVATMARKEKDVKRLSLTFNDKQFTVGDARMKAVEPLFNPKLLGKDFSLTLPELIVLACKSADVEKRINLVENIMLSGNWSNMKGLRTRLDREFEKLLPQTDFAGEFQPKDPKIAVMPDYIEAYKEKSEDVAFLGGALMAKQIFPDMKNYLTKLDYNEHGPHVINIKGY